MPESFAIVSDSQLRLGWDLGGGDLCQRGGWEHPAEGVVEGHKDGGVLIGRVYGHLNDEHARRQAKCLVFRD